MKVKFVPNNVECEIKPNESVLHVAHNNGIHIKSVCKGVPSCTECRIRVIDGEYNILQPSSKEISLIGNTFHLDGRRLSCQLKCFGDITVDLSEQVEKADRVLSGKRPRAGSRTSEAFDAEKSSARHGNIILDEAPVAAEGTNPAYEKELVESEKALWEEEKKRQLEELRSQRGGGTRDDGRGERDARGNGGSGQNRGGDGRRNDGGGQNRGAQGGGRDQGNRNGQGGRNDSGHRGGRNDGGGNRGGGNSQGGGNRGQNQGGQNRGGQGGGRNDGGNRGGQQRGDSGGQNRGGGNRNDGQNQRGPQNNQTRGPNPSAQTPASSSQGTKPEGDGQS
ncbi:MAG: (2Fe-2S)-binding protein [Bdellovibrionales bacterium]|nr:(2Fe-2S)-binding protein [Bdellovibrionales bacterium]